MRKIQCILLSVLMVLTMMPAMAFAAGSEDPGGTPQNVDRRLVFADAGNLEEDLENAESQIIENFNIADQETVTKYLYVGTFTRTDEGWTLTGLEPVSESAVPEVRYVVADTDGNPELDENDKGLTFRCLGGNRYEISCDFSRSEHLKDNKREGTFFYDVRLPNIGNTNIEVVELFPVSPNQNYDLYLDIPGMGQGPGLSFTDEVTSWKTCFYVVNCNNNYDARYWKESEHSRYRTYIGKPGDFVIEALALDGGEWQSIDTLDEKYRIFSLDYVGREGEYAPLFQIDYDIDKDNQYHGMSLYNYRVRYTGDDPYLNNSQKANNGFSIPLIYDTDDIDFEILEIWRYDDEEEYTTGNVLHFDSIGTKIRMKMVISPYNLQGGNGPDESEYIYIKDEAKNVAFLRSTGKTGEEQYEPLRGESPFTVEWDSVNEEYIVTYDHSERDLYGPGYTLDYWGDFPSKIREKYGEKLADDQMKTNRFASVYTAKMTTADKDFANGIIDARTDLKVNTTEVVFNQNAPGSAAELKVNTNDADVTLGGDLVNNMKTANETSDVSLLVRDVQEEPFYLTDQQKNAVSSMETALDFRVQSKQGTQDTAIDFGADGYAKVSIPCSETNPAVYYINDAGQKEVIPSACENGMITFTARHFSVYGIGKDTGESSGTGGSGFVPPASSDNVTNSGTEGSDNAATNADIGASVSTDGKANAEVNQTTGDQIIDKAVSNQSAEVIIDAATKNGNAEATTVTLPADTLRKLVEKTDAEITVKTDSGAVTIDQKAAETIVKEAADDQVAIIIEKTRDEKVKMEFELKVVSGGKVIGTFNGGRVKVTVKLNQALAALKDGKLTCVYIDDNGIYTKVGGMKNSDGTYTFTTTHFSSYAVMAEAEVDEIIGGQTAEAVENTKLAARSKNVKLKNGRKAIKVFWYAKDGSKLTLDGYEVYRSTKKNKGYGKKPFFTTKKTSYTNSKQLKKGTRYYYKVRGYKVIGGKKVYTPYSLKTIRTAK